MVKSFETRSKDRLRSNLSHLEIKFVDLSIYVVLIIGHFRNTGRSERPLHSLVTNIP